MRYKFYSLALLAPTFQNMSTIEEVLRQCLHTFRKEEMLSEYLEYLSSEWYHDLGDLKLALEDGDAWSNLRLPGRLKLEMKKLLLAICISPQSSNVGSMPREAGPQMSSSNSVWQKCFSVEYDTYYYYNLATAETQWNEPEGATIVDSEYCSDFDQSNAQPTAATDALQSKSPLYVSPLIEPSAPRFSPRFIAPASEKLQLPRSNGASQEKSFIPYPKPPDIDFSSKETKSTSAVNANGSTGRFPPRAESYTPVAVAMGMGTTHSSSTFSNHKRVVVDEESESDDSSVDEDLVVRLSEMGFERDLAEYALKQRKNNLSAAAAYLIRLQNGEEKLPESPTKLDDLESPPTQQTESDEENIQKTNKPKKFGIKTNLFGDKMKIGTKKG